MKRLRFFYFPSAFDVPFDVEKAFLKNLSELGFFVQFYDYGFQVLCDSSQAVMIQELVSLLCRLYKTC